jgi:hypothetical protein
MDEHDRIAQPRIDPTTTPFTETAAFRRYGITDDPDPDSPEALYTKAVIQEQGFDGPPHLLSRRELDRHVAAGEVELFRGVTEARFADQLRSGEFFVGRGWFADGMYAAPAPHGLGIARQYARAVDGTAIRMSLKGGTRVLSNEKIEERAASELEHAIRRLRYERNRAMQAARQQPEESAVRSVERDYERRIDAARSLYDDYSRCAAYLGFDAIHVVSSPDVDYYVILNRTAIRVQQENLR